MPTTTSYAPKTGEARQNAIRPERRNQVRLAARGELILHFDDGDTRDYPMRGDLLDISAGGYRIRHPHSDLRDGEELFASYGWGEMVVRAVWHRDTQQGTETGFRIIAPMPDELRKATPKESSARQHNVD